MGYEFELNGEVVPIHPAYRAEGTHLVIDGRSVDASLGKEREPGQHLLEIDGRLETVWIATHGDVHFIHLRGRVHRVEALNSLDRARRAAAASGGAEVLRAPMPGVVVEVVAEAGAEVESGQLLMTIESMKLQTAITAPHDATIEEICVATGASFDQGAALVRLMAEEAAGSSQEGKAK
jgi:3-methylcrotonyl-CoA carboxylase alpha subunit